jgi:hypothetical protein
MARMSFFSGAFICHNLFKTALGYLGGGRADSIVSRLNAARSVIIMALPTTFPLGRPVHICRAALERNDNQETFAMIKRRTLLSVVASVSLLVAGESAWPRTSITVTVTISWG